MKVFPAKKIFHLKDCVAPQSFGVRDGEVFYFDRMNDFEGRFCKRYHSETNELFETFDVQGVVTGDGGLYSINIGDVTEITRYNHKGHIQGTLKLNGTYFDFRLNETGNYICLGNIEGNTTIKIINENSAELAVITPSGIIFGSAVCVFNEYIYLAGFDRENRFMLQKMNYIGSTIESIMIPIKGGKRVIIKIDKYEDYFFMLVSGGSEEIIILNTLNNEVREIAPANLGLSSIVDINIINGDLYLLNGREVHLWDIKDLLNWKVNARPRLKRMDMDFIFYQFLMYIMGLNRKVITSTVFSMVVTILIFLVIYEQLGKSVVNTSFLKLFICLFIILDYTIASVACTFAFIKKATRIEYLLKINSRIWGQGIFLISAYMGIVGFAFTVLMLFPRKDIFLCIIISMLFFGVTLNAILISMKRVRETNRDVVIELLSDDDNKTMEYIGKALKNITKNRVERLYVDVITEGNVGVKRFSDWIDSRRNILGNDIHISVEGEKITTVLDLSKRNRKYSRFSILMDYVCFIKSKARIKELKIIPLDEKGSIIKLDNF